jgi:hypothetical protein
LGDLAWRSQGNWIGVPGVALGEHIVAIGASGAGKTEALLRFAFAARRTYGCQVTYIDAKGDTRADTPARFFAVMRKAGAANLRMFPASYYNGWRGSARDLYNRLLSIIDYSESAFYGDVAADVIRLAVYAPQGVPRSSQQFLSRLDLNTLKALYKGRPESRAVSKLERDRVNTVAMRYRVFFGALAGQLDGTLGYEDTDACYVQVQGFALRDEAARLGRFLAVDYAHYLAERKPRALRSLLIIDEVQSLRMSNELSTLFEQGRSFGGSCLIASQSVAAIGDPRMVDRILGAANTYVLMKCSDPEPIAERAGRTPTIQSNWAVNTGGIATARGSMRRYDDWKVHPDRVRSQERGEAYLINGGHAQQLVFAPVPVTKPEIDAARQMIRREEQAAPARTTIMPSPVQTTKPAPTALRAGASHPQPGTPSVAPAPSGKAGKRQPMVGRPKAPAPNPIPMTPSARAGVAPPAPTHVPQPHPAPGTGQAPGSPPVDDDAADRI